nr:hypothetical protein [Tanacetum cinerariifolium]
MLKNEIELAKPSNHRDNDVKLEPVAQPSNLRDYDVKLEPVVKPSNHRDNDVKYESVEEGEVGVLDEGEIKYRSPDMASNRKRKAGGSPLSVKRERN